MVTRRKGEVGEGGGEEEGGGGGGVRRREGEKDDCCKCQFSGEFGQISLFTGERITRGTMGHFAHALFVMKGRIGNIKDLFFGGSCSVGFSLV